MRNLWTRIGLGALGVFAIGMLLLTLVHTARESARNALLGFIGADSVVAAPAPAAPDPPAPVAAAAEVTPAPGRLASAIVRLANLRAGPSHARPEMAFRLDGDRIGGIEHLTIRRARRGDLPEVTLLVLLDDRSRSDRLARCDLVAVDGGDVAGERGFRCAAEGAAGLTTIGSARIEPLGISRPIRLTRRAVAEMRDGDPFEVNVDAGGQVRVTALGDDGQGVRLLADSAGASIKVDDALGRAIFRLLADSSGASLRVRGKNGRELVRMEAANGGFSLTVDTAAAN